MNIEEQIEQSLRREATGIGAKLLNIVFMVLFAASKWAVRQSSRLIKRAGTGMMHQLHKHLHEGKVSEKTLQRDNGNIRQTSLISKQDIRAVKRSLKKAGVRFSIEKIPAKTGANVPIERQQDTFIVHFKGEDIDHVMHAIKRASDQLDHQVATIPVEKDAQTTTQTATAPAPKQTTVPEVTPTVATPTQTATAKSEPAAQAPTPELTEDMMQFPDTTAKKPEPPLTFPIEEPSQTPTQPAPNVSEQPVQQQTPPQQPTARTNAQHNTQAPVKAANTSKVGRKDVLKQLDKKNKAIQQATAKKTVAPAIKAPSKQPTRKG